MLNPFQRGGVALYLGAKAGWSLANDHMMMGVPRRPVPSFDTPQAAATYYQGHGNLYTGDPLYGAADLYTHPNRVQAAIEIGPEQQRRTFIDCDDVAGWYLTALRGKPGITARIVTLVDAHLVGSHVICVGLHNGQPFGLDTNGYRDLPDLTEATLCKVWSDLYASEGYTYVAALDTPYPF